MERLTLTHLTGPYEGQKVSLDRFPVAIGSSPDRDVVVPGAAEHHAQLDRSAAGELVLRDAGSERGTFLAGQRVREAVLRDGDIVELGSGGPRVRLSREQTRKEAVLAALRGRDGQPPLAIKAWRRWLSRAGRNHPLRLALVALGAAIAGAAVLLSHIESRRLEREVSGLREAMRVAEEERRSFFAAIEAERRRNEEERSALENQLREFRAREAELTEEMAEAANETVRRDLEATRERIQALESERAVGENIIREYGSGVCLIQGSYAFYDASGKPLRHRLDENGRKLRDDDGSPSLSVDGEGAVYTVDYYGTGFLADRRGLVLSNRHVAVPWWDDDKAEDLKKDGFAPRFVLFRAFFPKEVEPFELEALEHSDSMDLAVLEISLSGRRIPVLPLDANARAAVPGQPVVVVGYPTGLEAILAKADTEVVQSILKRYGRQSEHVTEALSERGLIRPSTTQGHIGDVTPTDIVFDAPTTQGGSGGPVFNKSGQVVAIEYAVLPKFGGTAFGIPIHFAVDLIKAAKKARRSA